MFCFEGLRSRKLFHSLQDWSHIPSCSPPPPVSPPQDRLRVKLCFLLWTTYVESRISYSGAKWTSAFSLSRTGTKVRTTDSFFFTNKCLTEATQLWSFSFCMWNKEKTVILTRCSCSEHRAGRVLFTSLKKVSQKANFWIKHFGMSTTRPRCNMSELTMSRNLPPNHQGAAEHMNCC